MAISGMFHRMKQNAAGLATICILSTMLVVTVSGTLSLYLSQEETLRANYPYDAWLSASAEDMDQGALLTRLDAGLADIAEELGLTIRLEDSKVALWDSELGEAERELSLIHIYRI